MASSEPGPELDRRVAAQLEWTEPTPPDGECPYDHIEASTPFGRFLIAWKGWKDVDMGMVIEATPWGDFGGAYPTVQEAKDDAQKQWEAKLQECLAVANPAP